MDIKELINDYLTTSTSIEKLALKYHIGKIKVKQILLDNGVELKKKGGQSHNTLYIIPDWRIEKYNEDEGFHYVAVDKNDETFTTRDYMNQAGILTTRIKEKYEQDVPPLYYRREYYKKTGNYWWEQWFNIIKIKNSEVKKCPYCDWETIDINNKSGVFEQHLKEKHNKTIDDYIAEFPEDINYFSNYKKKKEKEEKYNDETKYVICPICGKKFPKITYTHLHNKHNMTLGEFKKKYPNFSIMSEDAIEQIRNEQLTSNLHISKHRFISKYEIEIQNWLKESNISFECNRQILIGKEIDILIQDKNIGIEFDGLRFDTEKFGKNRQYHLHKTLKCNEQGYGLIHIFEDEYVNHKEIVYSKLSHILQLDYKLQNIQGRKIKVKEIYKNDAMAFLDKYHIQGFTSSSVYIGGFYNDELIAVMSFKYGNVNHHNCELTRFATNYKYRYQGVGSKLFCYFVKKYEPNYIVSFADRRWTIDKDNNLYTHLGFELDAINAPDYRYYNPKIDKYKRVHKMTLNKQILHKKYGFPLTMTELEMTRELGYDRIWDCGLFKYVWTKKEVGDN